MISGNVQPIRPAVGIVCTNLRKINKGALVAFCDLAILAWHLEIKDCKLFKNDKGEWVGFPSTNFTSRDGKVVYKDVVGFSDKDAAARFQAAALAAIRKELE